MKERVEDCVRGCARLRGVADSRQSRARYRSLTGLRVTDVAGFLAALEKQGKVTTLADPRIVVLNNEPATARGLSQVPLPWPSSRTRKETERRPFSTTAPSSRLEPSRTAS
jgi:type II secretory pathway component GspD/PulD (secretin)